MAAKMKVKFDKYWGKGDKVNYLIYFASILDPSKKIEFVEFCFSKMYSKEVADELLVQVKAAFGSLFDEYKTRLTPPLQDSSVLVSVSNKGCAESSVSGIKQATRTMSKFKRFKKDIGKVENRTELDRYLDEDDVHGEDEEDFNVLNWWKLNNLRFPILSAIARDVLAIPISTVASESAFSTGGRVLDPYRSSLTPRLVQALVCTQDWLRGESIESAIVEEDLESLEKTDLDLSTISVIDKSLD